MIRKVRAKFVRIAIAALSVAMVLVALVINGANWYFVRQELQDTARLIADNNGQYPQGKGRGFRRASRESSYETRYFCITCDTSGGYAALNMENIASATQAEALALARQAAESGRDTGYIGNYLFYIRPRSNGSLITFIDCETRLNALRDLAWISVAACLAVILLSLLLVSLLSRRAIQPLIESAEKQKRFITDAGHELKTPLTVISANMDVLALDVGENEWISGTQKQVAGLRKLAADLVTLSRMDEDWEMNAQRFDLSEAVRDTATGFAAMAERTQKRLELDVAPDLFMSGDEGAIRRLVAILMDNALKYAPPSSLVRLALTAEGRRARLCTINELFEPLDDATLGRLFDRFYRADPARAKDGGKGGYGIGLAIAKAVVDKHGGKLMARRADGQRIEFVCLLPLAK